MVAGYRTYVELIEPLLTHQEVVATGMKAEVQRCQAAIDRALAGDRVALVSSGDAGIYGMAGLVLEICAARGLKVSPPDAAAEVDFHLEVIPGVPALAAGAALLGAPLMHDFASISLSDLLTPWETIQKRLELAAQGDFVIVLYNPKSKKRHWQLGAVQELLLRHKPPETPVGIVSRAMRQDQTVTHHHPQGPDGKPGGHADRGHRGQFPDLRLRPLPGHAPGLFEQVSGNGRWLIGRLNVHEQRPSRSRQ